MATLEQYISNIAKENDMDITPEAINMIQKEIESYVTKITQTTLALGFHKTLMPQDVEFALKFKLWNS